MSSDEMFPDRDVAAGEMANRLADYQEGALGLAGELHVFFNYLARTPDLHAFFADKGKIRVYVSDSLTVFCPAMVLIPEAAFPEDVEDAIDSALSQSARDALVSAADKPRPKDELIKWARHRLIEILGPESEGEAE